MNVKENITKIEAAIADVEQQIAQAEINPVVRISLVDLLGEEGLKQVVQAQRAEVAILRQRVAIMKQYC